MEFAGEPRGKAEEEKIMARFFAFQLLIRLIEVEPRGEIGLAFDELDLQKRHKRETERKKEIPLLVANLSCKASRPAHKRRPTVCVWGA